MAYQSSMAYPAASSGPWSGSNQADSTYYQQYYAAYGYGGNYDMSAYYQQQAPNYAAAGPVESSYQLPEHNAPEVSDSASAPPPAPPSIAPPAAPCEVPPPPDSALTGEESVPPPPPSEPPPPPGAPDSSQKEVIGLSADSVANPGGDATTASGGYDAAAYAQWYAQNYGAYYSYPGYDQQSYTYWQQQQHQMQTGAYGYGVHGYGQQQPQPSVPPPAPPSSDPPRVCHEKPQLSAAPSPTGDNYNAQAPPSGLYAQQSALKAGQVRHRTGPTGPNSVPIGPRPPPGDPPAAVASPATLTAGKQQPAIIIRSQLPFTKRPNASAAPAYISVGSHSTPIRGGGTPGGSDTAVAAAVAAGAASAAAAASAAKSAPPSSLQGSSQWPPSFSAWVTRCFNTARLRNVPDTRLSEKLMAYLDQVKAEGRLWTTDWDTLPIMLPDSPTAQHGVGGTTQSQVLSLGGTQNRKRNRWGAVPDVHASHEIHQGQDQHRQQHQALNGYRKRVYSVDSDEDDHAGKHASPFSGGMPMLSPHKAGGMQSVSNRKRKKLQLEQQHHQLGRRGGNGFVSAEEVRRRARAGRFGDGRAAGTGSGGFNDGDSSGMDMSDEEELAARNGGVVVGTCQALEKSYFRLTSQPDPSAVRPEAVLERALERLVAMIARGEATYFYSLDQFKGMRQDCTVQHLRNALAVRVYEAHARSSLEYSDTAEFNQCQARLAHLYGEGQPGCMAEFTAYRLLYETVHCATAGSREGSMAKSLLHTMRNVPRELLGSPEIRHALQVREAVMTYNYAAFFRLYASAPHLGRAIMDVVAESMRWAGLNAFVKACDLPLPVAEMAQLLGFSPRQAPSGVSDVEAAKPLPGCMRAHLAGDAEAAATVDEGVAECSDWLRDHGAVVAEKGAELLLDTKASRGKLFVPEVTAKVPHGDENLSLTDFLSQAQRGMAE